MPVPGDTKPAVLMLCKAFPPVLGGVETYSEQVAQAYTELGYAVTVITQTVGKRNRERRDAGAGPYDIWNVGRGTQSVVALAFARAISSYLSNSKPLMIHSTTWRPSVPLVLHRRSAPVVTSVHGREVLNANVVLARLQSRSLNRADAIVCGSGATRAALLHAVPGLRAPDQVSVDFYGLSHRSEALRFTPGQGRDSRVNILTVARHVKRKNIDGCLRAVASLDRNVLRNLHYRIAGYGPETAELHRLAEKLGLDDAVEFLGRVPDDQLVAEYKRADIFLHPQTHVGEGNDFEGFGLVIADAMSFGCVAIAGDAGGPADYVVDGATGFLVDGLRPAEIATRLEALITDARLRHEVGAEGREWALANLSWRRHAEYILNVAAQVDPGAGVHQS